MSCRQAKRHIVLQTKGLWQRTMADQAHGDSLMRVSGTGCETSNLY